MIKVFIFGVLALSSVSCDDKVGETFENGESDLLKQGSDYLFKPQGVYFKGDDSLNYSHRKYNVLNQNPTFPLEQQKFDRVAQYDSYAPHSNSRNYDYSGLNKNEYLPHSYHDLPLAHKQSLINNNRDGLEVTNKIPSMKLDQTFYRTLPKYSNHDYNYDHQRPRNAYEDLALKNLCVDCRHYQDEYSQNPTHYQHEKPVPNEYLSKDIHNPYLVHNFENNHGYPHEAYTEAEAEKQHLLDKINYIYYHGEDMKYTKPSQNNTNPREPLYKSDPHYLRFKPYYRDDNYEYKVKSNGLFPYGPKHVDYFPYRVNNYYESHQYTDKTVPEQETYYGYKSDASDRYTPNVYSEVLVYPRRKYEYERFNTTNNDTNTHKKAYYNPYFEYAPESQTVSHNNYSQSRDLTAVVLKNLLYSKNIYPSSYSDPHVNDLYNYKRQHTNNYAHGNYAPQNNRHEVEDNIQYPKNSYNQYVHSNNLYHNGHKNVYNTHNNYVPKRHFKDVVEEVNRILNSRKEHVPYSNAYYKDNQDHEHYNYKHLTPELYPKQQQVPHVNDDSDEDLFEPKNINNDYGQRDMREHYEHFRDVVEEAKKLLQPKNKYDPYANVHVSDFSHSRPRERHYGKLTHPFDGTSVGVLNPYKVRPNPYILPEYRRYQSQYDHPPRNYNYENLS